MINHDDEFGYIFVKYITTRNGKRIYAYQKGRKAFRIRAGPKRLAKTGRIEGHDGVLDHDAA